MADTGKIQCICSSPRYYIEVGPGKQHLMKPVKLPDQPFDAVSHHRVADFLADGNPDSGGAPEALLP